jgi:acetyl-CoA synthetase
MSEHKIYELKSEITQRAHINSDQYRSMYKRSIDDPEAFWAEQAGNFLDWFKPWEKVMEYDYPRGYIRWFEGGKLNVSVNCLDRHLAERGDQIAIIWESDDPTQAKKITYRDLHTEVCKFANVLKSLGVQKGDRVCVYLPMIVEAAVAMLACTRLGAIHSIVFGGFSAEALRDRIADADCTYVVCADEGLRGGRTTGIKVNVDKALQHCLNVKKSIVVKNTGGSVGWHAERDVWYHEAMAAASSDCSPEFSIPPGRPANPKACCIPPAATCCLPR